MHVYIRLYFLFVGGFDHIELIFVQIFPTVETKSDLIQILAESSEFVVLDSVVRVRRGV